METNTIILACSGCGTRNRIPHSRMDHHPVCGKCKTPLPVDQLEKPMAVTDATFDFEVFSATLPVLVDCWAPWCGPCRAFAPVLDTLAVKYQYRLKIVKLNVDENPAVGSRFSITSVPTLMLVKNGQLVERFAGALPMDQLEQRIKRLL